MLHQTIETPPRPGPESKWTAEVRTKFLDYLARTGNVRRACWLIGVSAEIAYRLRRRDPAFARGWAAAMVLARHEAEQVLAEQALEGIAEDVYYRGELIGSRRRFDARLLLAHLGRLDKLADDPRAKTDAQRFDEILAVVAGEDVPEELGWADDVLPPSRRRHLAEAAETARIEQIHSEIDEDEAQAAGEGEADDDFPLDDEERWQREVEAEEEREALREQAAAEAMFEAGRDWDAWQARAHAAVDRALAADLSAAPVPQPAAHGGPMPVGEPDGESTAEPRQQCQQWGGAGLESTPAPLPQSHRSRAAR